MRKVRDERVREKQRSTSASMPQIERFLLLYKLWLLLLKSSLLTLKLSLRLLKPWLLTLKRWLLLDKL